jgi:hypothetical protein
MTQAARAFPLATPAPQSPRIPSTALMTAITFAT